MLLREDKAEHIDQVLTVGETVMLNIYDAGAEGVIVECLNEAYVRVKWSDFAKPTLHSVESLKARARQRAL